MTCAELFYTNRGKTVMKMRIHGRRYCLKPNNGSWSKYKSQPGRAGLFRPVTFRPYTTFASLRNGIMNNQHYVF